MSEEKPPEEKPLPLDSGKAAFNLVTDTVAGPNLRFKDNVYQAIAIFVCLVLGAGIGLLAASDRLMGLIFGAFIGLLAGLFGSGIVLGIYRALRHAKGKHD
jgi:hypothetical protein